MLGVKIPDKAIAKEAQNTMRELRYKVCEQEETLKELVKFVEDLSKRVAQLEHKGAK